jgi:type II secretory pathway predicted ATPase ExeA
MNKKLLSLYGLKWNPFSPDLPPEALRTTAGIESFCWRIEQSLVREGGFALISGEPGTGKSVALRLLAERLAQLRDVTVGALAHPQSNVADFYREMGDLFGVPLKPHNRWGGFKALRERWHAHIETTLVRPVLLVDEAQEMSPQVLSELRLLASTRFDSRIILAVVLAGDGRLRDLLRRPELLSLGSRIRTRLALEVAPREQLLATLEHLLDAAGNRKLMTPELMHTLADHALGNLRVLTTMGAELLAAAAQHEITQLDEKLYLEVFAAAARPTPAPRRAAAGRRRA